tara:strand:+ start:72 stop:563 length:492 start_codon:yes stop_codon:yes gene_type:complete
MKSIKDLILDKDSKKSISDSIGKLMTPEEIASLLSISPRTVYDYAQKGKIPAIKLLGQWRFKESDIVSWIDNMQNQTFSSSPDQIRAENFDKVNKILLQRLDEAPDTEDGKIVALESISLSDESIPREILYEVIESMKKNKKIEFKKNYKLGNKKQEVIIKRR